MNLFKVHFTKWKQIHTDIYRILLINYGLWGEQVTPIQVNFILHLKNALIKEVKEKNKNRETHAHSFLPNTFHKAKLSAC